MDSKVGDRLPYVYGGGAHAAKDGLELCDPPASTFSLDYNTTPNLFYLELEIKSRNQSFVLSKNSTNRVVHPAPESIL